MRKALTIAGSDSGGGAGIQADLKTFQRFETFGTSALTLVTAQNTRGVSEVHLLPPGLVAHQIDAVCEDLPPDAAKTGALGSAAIVEVVAAAVERHGVRPLVVDPVMISKHGAPLIAPDAVDALKRSLFPLAALITPNLHEASALLGREVRTEADMRRAARDLMAFGCGAVLLKGGHLPGPEAVDLLFDGVELRRFAAPRVDTPHTHGTGCTYSAAIAALLANRRPLAEAVAEAKAYLTRAIATAPGLGAGQGPVNHWA